MGHRMTAGRCNSDWEGPAQLLPGQPFWSAGAKKSAFKIFIKGLLDSSQAFPAASRSLVETTLTDESSFADREFRTVDFGFEAKSVVTTPQSTISNQPFINQSLRAPSWFFVPLRGYLFSFIARRSKASPR